MDINTKINLIKGFSEEIITEQELKNILETKSHPIAYDGFEPSGIPHIAQGIIRAININKMTSIGIKFKMFVADWHAWANNKYGGDLDKIQTAGKFFIEMWKVSGMDLKNVEFVWANDFIEDKDYWKKVMHIARNSTINRVIRCGQIMGRKDGDVSQASQILYPCMQAADIFHMNVDIAQLGMDQRKVNVLAREIGEKLFGYKPVAVHHHMLMGLGQPPKSENTKDRVLELKMSKSKPDTAIFMMDTEEKIKSKIKNAYCPEGIDENNPILEYCKYIIFEKFKTFEIKRDKKFGGDLVFENYGDLVKSFKNKDIHPLDLKISVAEYINKLIEPIRNHFEKNKKARELYNSVSKYIITR
ncbi:tyrosine--tRNA ligase [Candidatus Woesearchaeota archaeon]|nr:tyrosine--tRNA ligase [Candidatus Woesearchaeota archaeon]